MLTNQRLTDSFTVPNTLSVFYSNNSPYKTFIRGFILHNRGTAVGNFKGYIVYSTGGVLGTANDSNKFFDLDLQVNETISYTAPYPVLLQNLNDSFFVSSNVTTLNLILLGDKLE